MNVRCLSALWALPLTVLLLGACANESESSSSDEATISPPRTSTGGTTNVDMTTDQEVRLAAIELGDCDFTDPAFEILVRQRALLVEDDVQLIESLDIHEDVVSIEGIGCLLGLRNFHVSRPFEPAEQLDITPLVETGIRLRSVKLNYGNFSGISILAELELEHLEMRGVGLKDLSFLVAVSSIETLNIAGAKLASLQGTESLVNLKRLDLGESLVTSLVPLAGASKLEWSTVKDAPLKNLDGLQDKQLLDGISI